MVLSTVSNLSYTCQDVVVMVPEGITSVRVHMWGAGGGVLITVQRRRRGICGGHVSTSATSADRTSEFDWYGVWYMMIRSMVYDDTEYEIWWYGKWYVMIQSMGCDDTEYVIWRYGVWYMMIRSVGCDDSEYGIWWCGVRYMMIRIVGCDDTEYGVRWYGVWDVVIRTTYGHGRRRRRWIFSLHLFVVSVPWRGCRHSKGGAGVTLWVMEGSQPGARSQCCLSLLPPRVGGASASPISYRSTPSRLDLLATDPTITTIAILYDT